MQHQTCTRRFLMACLLSLATLPITSFAHHVLGRPAYSLSEDSNTPPSMQVETRIGDYYVTYMVFPAFPQPGKPGRLNLYASRIDNGKPYNGQISFYIRDDKWFGAHEEKLGVQSIDDGVYRQGFVASESGKYIISAQFQENGVPYIIDFPLSIGDTSSLGPIGITIIVIVCLLLVANIVQRRRLVRSKIRQAQQQEVQS